MQQTDFEFEVLIHDDASTDNTAKIIREYQTTYPHIIKPIYQSENQYSRGVGVSRTFQFPRAAGKYIALCEGDDYWTDPCKLQQQVDFLESNPQYGLIHSDCNFLYQSSGKILEKVNKSTTMNCLIDREKVQAVGESVLMGDYKVRTATALFRKDLYYQSVENDPEVFSSKYKMGDIQIWFGISKLSQIKYWDEVTAVYRINKGSVTQSKKKINHYRFQLSSVELRVYYILKYEFTSDFNKYIKKEYNRRLLKFKVYDRDYVELFPMFTDSIDFEQACMKLVVKSKLLCRFFVNIDKLSGQFTLKHFVSLLMTKFLTPKSLK